MGQVNNVIVISFSFPWKISHVTHTIFFHTFFSLVPADLEGIWLESILYSPSWKFSMTSWLKLTILFLRPELGSVNHFPLSMCSHSEYFTKKAFSFFIEKSQCPCLTKKQNKTKKHTNAHKKVYFNETAIEKVQK